MNSSRILLCPGQGAQALGMGKAWYDASPAARQVFDEADSVLGNRLGAKLTDLCFNGPVEKLNQTDISQPAIYVASVASWHGMLEKAGLGERSIETAGVMCVAGLSLGEYTALHLAGAFSFRDGLELVTLRGRAMQDAADAVKNPDGTPGSGMVAIIGGDDGQAAQIAEKARGDEVLVCANFNAPGQVVLSGHRTACVRAGAVAEEMGLRASQLAVAGAFHSPIMAPAAARLKAALEKTAIGHLRATVVGNVTAKPHVEQLGLTIEKVIRQRLVEQLTSPVRWADSCRWMAAGVWGSGTYVAGQSGGGAEYHELAPGTTLKGLMRRIDKAIKVTSHDSPND